MESAHAVESVLDVAGSEGDVMSKAFFANYIANAHFEDAVADALVNARGLRGKLMGVANAVKTQAQINVEQAPKSTPGDAKNVDAVRSDIKVLPVAPFTREQALKGTVTNVALVVSDDWRSRWYEFGKGRGTHFPATHFMRMAAISQKRGPVGWFPRGRSKSGAAS